MSAPPAIDPLLTRQGELLLRVRSGPDVDEYGNPIYQDVGATVACEIQQAGSREELDGAVQVSTWRIFLPGNLAAGAIVGINAVRVDGSTYEFQGDLWPVYNPRTGAVHHVEGYAVRVQPH